MNMLQRARTLLMITTMLCALTALSAMAQPAPGSQAVQDATPTPSPTPNPAAVSTSYLVARTELEALPSGPVTMTAATVILGPGISTQAFANPGPTVIGVQDGRVILTADAATVTSVMVSGIIGVQIASDAPAPVTELVVYQNQQIVIPEGVRAEIRGAGDQPARLLLVTLISQSQSTPEAGGN